MLPCIAELASALKPAKISDATRLLGDLRIIKSETEMRYVREAAGYANLGLDAAREALQAGVTEIEVAAAVEGTLCGRRVVTTGPYLRRSLAVLEPPEVTRHHVSELLSLGDIVHFEFAGVSLPLSCHRSSYHGLWCTERESGRTL